MINYDNLISWKKDSLSTAANLGYDLSVLVYLQLSSNFVLLNSSTPDNVWFGNCVPSYVPPEVEVYNNNISLNPSFLEKKLSFFGFDDKKVKSILDIANNFSSNEFFHMFNQSWMDYFLIGNLYNYHKSRYNSNNHNLESSVLIQFEFAISRNWSSFSDMMVLINGFTSEKVKEKIVDFTIFK